jgi:hypothetical protein
MVSLTFFFVCFMIVFGIVGAVRGWAKEMLVTFSAVLAFFLITVLETYIPVVRESFATMGPVPQFWLRTIIIIIMAVFGYQTPNFPKLGGARFVRERLQDSLLGFVLGMVNCFLIVGTIWYYMSEAGYPFKTIMAPVPGTPMGDAAISLMHWMAPSWLVIPYVYFAVGIAFVFVIVVFL